jgi:hypothetical protein
MFARRSPFLMALLECWTSLAYFFGCGFGDQNCFEFGSFQIW